jgi:phosphoenolpyruvate carboxykinase (ATP)
VFAEQAKVVLSGELKKAVFTILNYVLPPRGVMPMHCSANIGPDGDTAIFFGLSGTGKTTLSADPSRTLIGDDEHGWSDTAVFNLEGGCYAKMIRLSPEAEPVIHAATRRFGTILENVVVDPVTRCVDLDDASLTENTRGAYPIDFVPNSSAENMGPVPKNIIMLTADAFGVLPPISKLSPEQAMYHFLSGYTAKVAGTELGVTEPEATFSTCFGAPFMPRYPWVYGDLLKSRIARTRGSSAFRTAVPPTFIPSTSSAFAFATFSIEPRCSTCTGSTFNSTATSGGVMRHSRWISFIGVDIPISRTATS